MRENRMSGSMRGRRKRAVTYRACVLLYPGGPAWEGSAEASELEPRGGPFRSAPSRVGGFSA